MPQKAIPPSRRLDVLSDALLSTVDLLRRCRAADIVDGLIDAYVALDWLEWHGGSLRLTTVGENQCKRLSAQVNIDRFGYASPVKKRARRAAA